MKLTQQEINKFRRTVYDYFTLHGRHTLLWRTTHTDPYHILVSEIMLQQTQVDRVIPKFLEWVKHFPTIQTLAQAPQRDVLEHWSGLGYNRRALNLHAAAHTIVENHQGNVPQTQEELESLPGIGPYTAPAIRAFAFNKPAVVIETNIRSVFIHHFFSRKNNVHDRDIIPLIEITLDRDNPRRWYSALMDYGAYLKATTGNAARSSAHYITQSKFEGSRRQLRGVILDTLIEHPRTISEMQQKTGREEHEIRSVASDLAKEGFLEVQGETLRLA